MGKLCLIVDLEGYCFGDSGVVCFIPFPLHTLLPLSVDCNTLVFHHEH